jgi:hypothetical protein
MTVFLSAVCTWGLFVIFSYVEKSEISEVNICEVPLSPRKVRSLDFLFLQFTQFEELQAKNLFLLLQSKLKLSTVATKICNCLCSELNSSCVTIFLFFLPYFVNFCFILLNHP